MTESNSEVLLTEEQLHFNRLNGKYTKLTVGLILSLFLSVVVSLGLLPLNNLGLGWTYDFCDCGEPTTSDEFFDDYDRIWILWLFYVSWTPILFVAWMIAKREKDKAWKNAYAAIDSEPNQS
jgi:hypothetical protein